MPMSFPTMKSLKDRAVQRHFRQPLEDETEEVYREAFAQFMQPIDMVEAGEIRLGGYTAMPMTFVGKTDPLLALASITGKSVDEMNDFLNQIFSEDIK